MNNRVKQPKYPGFEFKPRQVNDSSQSNQVTYHLVSQSPPWWVCWQQKAQSLNFESKAYETQLEDQRPRKSSRRSSRWRKIAKPTKGMKSGKPSQNGKEELRKAQNYKKKLTKLPLTISMQALPLK
jgi:hypothetical protein